MAHHFVPRSCRPISAVHGMMVPAAGPLVSAASITAARSVKATTPASTVLFRRPGHISSAPARLPQLGVSASGVDMVAIPHSGTCQKDLVHSVNTLCSVQSEDSLFTVSDNAFLSVTDLPATCQFTSVHSVNTSHSVQASNDLVPMSVNAPLSIDELPAQCQLSTTHSPGFTLLSSPRSVRQELVPPSRVTPIDAHKLQRELCLHPNQALVDYVISGLSFGFRLGFNPESVSLKSASQNMPTAFLQPSVIDQYLLPELEKGRVAGPFSISPLANLHISRFGIIPKKYQPRKWRLILDLSSPQGHSVNDGIPKDPFSVQ